MPASHWLALRACAHRPAGGPAPKAAAKWFRGWRSFSPVSPPFFPLFPGGLPIVAPLAQALQIVWVAKQRPISPMGLDVVYHSGPSPYPLLGTGSAKGLPQQLPRPQVLLPQRQVIQVMPPGAGLPLRFGRFMCRAISLPDQLSAPWVAARPHGAHSHWITSLGKKRADWLTSTEEVSQSALGSKALGSGYSLRIHCGRPGICKAIYAPRYPAGSGIVVCHNRGSTATRSLLCSPWDYYTPSARQLDRIFTPFENFLCPLHLLYMVSRQKKET